jgi:hypothetical protein
MKRDNIILPVLLMLGLIISMASPVHANSTIFFDDFISSGFPSQWAEAIPASLNNLQQQSGYAIVTASRTALSSVSDSLEGMIANTSIQNSPINSATPDGQFILMSWKMQPFNLTALPSNGQRAVELMFGLSVAPPANFVSAVNSIYFDLWISDKPGGFGVLGSGAPVSNGAKSAIFFNVQFPMNAAAKCFDNPGAVLINQAGSCQPSIQYSSPTNPIDLNSQHVFTMEMKLYPVSHTSWIAFNVDNMAWMNYTQKACSCIDQTAAGGSYGTMYPFVEIGYAITPTVMSGGVPNQSVASQIDWTLVTDYIPTTSPAGQILFSNINPPTTLPNPFNTFGPSDSLVAFMTFEANSFAPGNIYAGGMLLLGLTVGIMGFVLGGLVYRTKLGLGSMGFMWTLGSLGICFFFFYCQIVPLWLPVMQTVVTAGIVFGIIRTGNASGGLIPD